MSRPNSRQTLSMPGKWAAHPLRVQVRQVEVDVGMPRLLHAADDRPRHHVARGQLAARVFVRHEADAVLVAQVGALAAHRLADEVTAGTGDIEDRRMELHELHVAQLRPGPVGGGHAVAGRHRRVGRLAVDHAGAAAGQDRLLRPDEQVVAPAAPHQGADAAAGVRHQVDGECAVPNGDIGRFIGAVDDRPHDLPAGGVAQGVDDASVAVAALHADFRVEMGAVTDQLVDVSGRLAHHHLDHVAVAQTGPGRERVLDMVLETVFRRTHRGDAALGVAAVAQPQLVLCDDQHRHVRRRRQGRSQPGDAAADHQQVGEDVRGLLRAEADQITKGKCHTILAKSNNHHRVTEDAEKTNAFDFSVSSVTLW